MDDTEFIRGRIPDRVFSLGPAPAGAMFESGDAREAQVYRVPDEEDAYIVNIVTFEYYCGHPMEGGFMRRDLTREVRRMTGRELRRLGGRAAISL